MGKPIKGRQKHKALQEREDLDPASGHILIMSCAQETLPLSLSFHMLAVWGERQNALVSDISSQHPHGTSSVSCLSPSHLRTSGQCNRISGSYSSLATGRALDTLCNCWGLFPPIFQVCPEADSKRSPISL